MSQLSSFFFAQAPLTMVLCAISVLPGRGQNMADAAPPANDRRIAPKIFNFTNPNSTLSQVLEDLNKQTGLEVDSSAINRAKPIKAAFTKTEFWNVVDSLAAQSGCRVSIRQQGKHVRLVSIDKPVLTPVSVDGPFRIAAHSVEARIDLLTQKRVYDLTIELAWEPRLHVYRVDAGPRITKAQDDAGKPVTVQRIDARNPVDGVVTTIRISLEGLDRTSKQIAIFAGSIRVTAAEDLQRFAFDDLTKATNIKMQGVDIALRTPVKEGDYWLLDMELHYPKDSAVFESFETYWVSRNRLILIAPGGGRFVATNEEINGNVVRYRFKQDKAKGFTPQTLKGWKAEYEAPSTLHEVPVEFELKDIALP